MRAETPRLKNELVARFLRRPWWADQFYDTADEEAQMKLFKSFSDGSSARICTRIMQPLLPQEKLFPPSDEAPLTRFRHHRWRYDMAEKFRAALAEKGQIVPPPDAADMPKDPATGEEV